MIVELRLVDMFGKIYNLIRVGARKISPVVEMMVLIT